MGRNTKKLILGVFLGTIMFLFGLFFYFFQKTSPSRINFLVLGVAGKGYTGKDLTDTIIFVSADNQTRKTLLLSLPRDIWIAPLRTKLNSVYHYKGLEETKKIISESLGQPVDYGIVIDFAIFKKIIDTLGRITVEVERSFDDFKYPIPSKENDLCNGDLEYKCRYEHIHFEAGRQTMDGEIALKFVRSRNAEGEEGTDFARAQRQQKVVLAIKDKILSPKFLFAPRKPLQLIKLVTLNIQTDIPKETYWQLAKLALRFKTKNLKMKVLNNNYLVNPPSSKEKYDNQWVLVPKSGNWKEIQEYLRSLL